MLDKYYGYYHSPIGILEIISSEDAILSAMFSEDKMKVTEKPAILKEALRQFDEYFRGIRKNFDLRYQVQGTKFQKRVWLGLTKIPYGETLSYKELAVIIGNEKAARAVGQANSKNVLSIIIPCHRVIGSNQCLIGYAGGLDRKRWLLEHEKRFLGAKTNSAT